METEPNKPDEENGEQVGQPEVKPEPPEHAQDEEKGPPEHAKDDEPGPPGHAHAHGHDEE